MSQKQASRNPPLMKGEPSRVDRPHRQSLLSSARNQMAGLHQGRVPLLTSSTAHTGRCREIAGRRILAAPWLSCGSGPSLQQARCQAKAGATEVTDGQAAPRVDVRRGRVDEEIDWIAQVWASATRVWQGNDMRGSVRWGRSEYRAVIAGTRAPQPAGGRVVSLKRKRSMRLDLLLDAGTRPSRARDLCTLVHAARPAAPRFVSRPARQTLL